jgi:hypothetical protein
VHMDVKVYKGALHRHPSGKRAVSNCMVIFLWVYVSRMLRSVRQPAWHTPCEQLSNDCACRRSCYAHHTVSRG